MKLFHTTLSTPIGPFSLAVRAGGALLGAAFGGGDVLARRLRVPAPELCPGESETRSARSQVEAYFSGALREFDLEVEPDGTEFQRKVWEELARIPFGETRSYAALARNIGSSPRAVGAANAANPLCLIVPCHRVIGVDGGLTGFAFGTERKRWLLAHERRTCRAGEGRVAEIPLKARLLHRAARAVVPR